MNCLDCRERIQSFLDGAACETAELRGHIETCADCRREWSAARLLRDGVGRLPRPQMSVTLAAKLVAAVTEDRRLRRRRWIQGVAWISGAAAVLFGVLVLPHLWRSTGNPVVVEKHKEVTG